MDSIRCLMCCVILITLGYLQYGWTMSKHDSLKFYDGSYMCMKLTQDLQTDTGYSQALTIHGDYLKAAMVAGKEFQEYLKEKWKGNTSPVAPHSSDISNYSISIAKSDNGSMYKVVFSPMPFMDSPIRGGGTTYTIDSKSFKILNKEHSM